MRATTLVALAVAGVMGGTARADKQLRVAVMDFTAASTASALEVLGTGLQSMLTTDLSEVPTLALVERARLHDIQNELKLSQTGAVDKETAAKIGSLAGASHILVGSFTVVGGKMRIDARLFTVATGEIAFGEKIEGEQTAFFDLEKQLVKKIVDAVGVKLGRKEKAELGKPRTRDFEAFQKFSEGLVLFDERKPELAVAAMEAAVARDPGFALAATKLGDFKRVMAMMPPPKLPEAPSCKQNPLFSPPCTPDGSTPASPTVFSGNGTTQIVVRAGGNEARCVTPCQLHLPPGPVDVEVVDPVHYRKQLIVPGGPVSVTVSTRSRNHLITGIVMTVLTLAFTATAIGLAESGGVTASTAGQYWPLFAGLAAGAAFPSVFYFLQMGHNDAKVTSLNKSMARGKEPKLRLAASPTSLALTF